MEKSIASCSLSLALLAIAFFIAGCGLASNDSDDDFEMVANIEGQKWEGVSNWEIFGDTVDVSGIQRMGECDFEGLYMRIADFEGTGTYPIFRTAYTFTVGCDAGSSYGSAQDTTGALTITSFDEFSAIIEGEFEFELIARYDHENLREGEPFTVTGRFRAKIDSTD